MLSSKVILIWMAACALVPAMTQDTRNGFESAVDPNTRVGGGEGISDKPGMTEEQLQYLLWLYRTEDSSAWNYSVLALSLVALFLGLLLLGLNVIANRTRKTLHIYKTELEATRTPETDTKQASLMLKDSDSLKQDPFSDTVLTTGKIAVQWKDGNVTPLYRDLPEEDV